MKEKYLFTQGVLIQVADRIIALNTNGRSTDYDANIVFGPNGARVDVQPAKEIINLASNRYYLDPDFARKLLSGLSDEAEDF